MKPPDPIEHFIEHIPCHHYLSKLKHEPPRMAYQTSTYLDEPRLNTGQRPVFYSFRQSQPTYEVTQIVSQDEQPQPHLIGYELVTR